MSATTMEHGMEAPQKLNIHLPYDSAIALLGIYLQYKSTYMRGTCTPMFIATLFTTAMLWNQLRGPTTDERVENMLCTHTHRSNISHKEEWSSKSSCWAR
jgi:hypothetical protein